MKDFSKRLTFLRENKGLSKKELAVLLNVSSPCISQYERGDSMPGYDILIRMSHYFGVSVDYLIGNNTSSSLISLESKFTEEETLFSFLKKCQGVPLEKRQVLLDLIQALQK